jgi:Flp pilus assembly protein TadG
MATLVLPMVLLPVVGLAVDSTWVYLINRKLQGAVDAGAVAAAQSLNYPQALTSGQQTTATLMAQDFIGANLQLPTRGSTGSNGYFNSFGLNDVNTVVVENPTSHVRTVTIGATLQAPMPFFTRIAGANNVTVAAQGQASRRSVVLMLVLDRSSSMDKGGSGQPIGTLKDSASAFVSQFVSGADRLGLIILGGSSVIAYPPQDFGKDWTQSVLSGPDTAFKDPDGNTLPGSPTANTATPNMLTSIYNINAGSNTGSAEALMLAYKELQALNATGALNVIVFFTDGQPNGITALFNDPVNSAIKPGSSCVNKANGNVVPMLGWMAQWNNYAAGVLAQPTSYNGANMANNGHGVYVEAQTDKIDQTSVTGWMKNPTEPALSNAGSNSCAYVGSTGSTANQWKLPLDAKIPTQDYYGNLTGGVNDAAGGYTTNDYKLAEIWTNTAECANTNQPASYLPNNAWSAGDACQIGLASWNAADMAGRKIHQDTVIKPIIYCMGYQGDGGDDPHLMARLANVPFGLGDTNTNNLLNADGTAKLGQIGKYYAITDASQIAGTFQDILGEILRITQ